MKALKQTGKGMKGVFATALILLVSVGLALGQVPFASLQGYGGSLEGSALAEAPVERASLDADNLEAQEEGAEPIDGSVADPIIDGGQEAYHDAVVVEGASTEGVQLETPQTQEPVQSEDAGSSMTAQAEGDEVTPRAVLGGTCGSCSWSVDTDRRTLTIGAGTLTSYTSVDGWPWHIYRKYVDTVIFSGTVNAAMGASYMFANMPILTSFTNLSSFNVSNAYYLDNLFSGSPNIGALSFSGQFNPSRAVTMKSMFEGCEGLASISFASPFTTTNAMDMSNMFKGCANLTSLDLSRFDTSKVVSMQSMFQGCVSLGTVIFSPLFSAANTTDMSYMFTDCNALTSLNLSGFSTSKVTTMRAMFWNCWALETLILPPSFVTSSLNDANSMFAYCTNLASLDLSGFDTSGVADMSYMFYGLFLVESFAFPSTFTTLNVTAMPSMFAECVYLKTLDLSTFLTPKVVNMSGLFSDCWSLTSVDMPNFITSSSTSMDALFSGCSALVRVNIGAGFYFNGAGSRFPTPSGMNSQGDTYTGLWKAEGAGTSYIASTVPSYRADVYTAHTLAVRIEGALSPGSMLMATADDGGVLTLTYQWSRGNSPDGPFTNIVGSTARGYRIPSADVGKYLRCTVSSGTNNASAVAGPVVGQMDGPTINGASLNADGSIDLSYTTHASSATPYVRVDMSYKLDTGAWQDYGALPNSASAAVETKVAHIDFSGIFSGDGPPSVVTIRVKGVGASVSSDWSEESTMTPDAQISVSVPISMTATVWQSGDITAGDQIIRNNGTLNTKVTNIAMTMADVRYPASTWACTDETGVNVIWLGTSTESGPVLYSPLVAPAASIEIVWAGRLESMEGLPYSPVPFHYGNIIYTVGFSAA